MLHLMPYFIRHTHRNRPLVLRLSCSCVNVVLMLSNRPICSLVWCSPTTRGRPTPLWCWWLRKVLQVVRSNKCPRMPSTPYLFPPPRISPTWHIHKVCLVHQVTLLCGGGGVRNMYFVHLIVASCRSKKAAEWDSCLLHFAQVKVFKQTLKHGLYYLFIY